MSPGRSYPKMLILIVIAMLVLGTLAALVVSQANRSRSRIPVLGELTEFELTAAHNGELAGPESLKGKICVYDFIFTSCRGPCPVMAVNMGELYRLYKGSGKIQFASISVDPNRDTLEALNEYAELQRVDDDGWIFLRGPLEKVAEICEEQFMLPAEDLPGGHTTKFILVDHLGRIRSYHDGLSESSMEILQNNIRQLAKELP
ncbi:MAG: SCO family protein [Candidatus Zixiibacteriota bacterium]|nr:MAG: SCO family protein [candidate division Zixibacteria bacterium]